MFVGNREAAEALPSLATRPSLPDVTTFRATSVCRPAPRFLAMMQSVETWNYTLAHEDAGLSASVHADGMPARACRSSIGPAFGKCLKSHHARKDKDSDDSHHELQAPTGPSPLFERHGSNSGSQAEEDCRAHQVRRGRECGRMSGHRKCPWSQAGIHGRASSAIASSDDLGIGRLWKPRRAR